jgi:hypothetical protein
VLPTAVREKGLELEEPGRISLTKKGVDMIFYSIKGENSTIKPAKKGISD